MKRRTLAIYVRPNKGRSAHAMSVICENRNWRAEVDMESVSNRSYFQDRLPPLGAEPGDAPTPFDSEVPSTSIWWMARLPFARLRLKTWVRVPAGGSSTR